jgi:hypothetical protein
VSGSCPSTRCLAHPGVPAGTPEWDERVTYASLPSERLPGLHVIYLNPYGTGLKTDPELDALCGREDFKKLVAGLDAEAAARKK